MRTEDDGAEAGGASGARVTLYVYDVSQGMASQLAPMLLGTALDGIWHTGVVVFGREYYYGGGIQWAAPGATIAGSPLRRIHLGVTQHTQQALHDFLARINHRFTPQTYNLLRHNCNNFSNELSLFLTGNPIPDFITGLPQQVLNTPIGAMLVPLIEQFESSMRSSGGGLVPWQESAAPSDAAATTEPQQQQPPAAATATATAPVPTKAVAAHRRQDPHLGVRLHILSSASKPLMSVDSNAALFQKQMRPSLLHGHEQQLIADLVEAIAAQKSPSSAAIPVFKRLVNAAPITQLFPVLALLRLAVAHQSFSLDLMSQDQGSTMMFAMMNRVFGAEADNSASSTPMSVEIMALCVLSNAISHLGYAHDLALSEAMASHVLRALRSPKASVRMMGATAAYNSSLHLQFDSADGCDRDDVAIQYISALAEILPGENDAPTTYRGLLALGHLVYFMGSEGSMLLQALGFDASAHQGSDNVRNIVEDISTLLVLPQQ